MSANACDQHEKRSKRRENDEKSGGFACYYMNASRIITDMVYAVNGNSMTLEGGYPINPCQSLA